MLSLMLPSPGIEFAPVNFVVPGIEDSTGISSWFGITLFWLVGDPNGIPIFWLGVIPLKLFLKAGFSGAFIFGKDWEFAGCGPGVPRADGISGGAVCCGLN